MSLPATVRQAVENVLSARCGRHVRIAGVARLQVNSSVSRCTLEPAGGAVPPAVIVRVRRDDAGRSGLAPLHNERAALELLRAVGSDLAPRFLAADDDAGILLSADLGPGPLLLDLLLGADPVAAREGLIAFARGLGTLHAQTARRASEYASLRAALGPPDPSLHGVAPPGRVTVSWQRVRDAAAQLGLPSPRHTEAEVEEIARTLAGPPDHLALSSGDVGPINCTIAGGTARFFDFEYAGFRHALLDATVLRYPYPTGGPVWRLPPAVEAESEHAYRHTLAQACPDAVEGAAYERGMAAACAAWTLLRLERLPRVDAGPDRDTWPLVPATWSGPLPTRSRRRQLVAIVETCLAAARRARAFDALGDWCETTLGALRMRWPEAHEEVPLFAAFR